MTGLVEVSVTVSVGSVTRVKVLVGAYETAEQADALAQRIVQAAEQERKAMAQGR